MATTLATVLAANGGCSFETAKPEIEYEAPQGERYENHIEIEGQWGSSIYTKGQYGIGDPFVTRFNGKYYLYPSTSDPCDGIKVFESEDLVNWTYKGMAVAESEQTVHGAYAPEVIYYNGYFYMCQSRAGKGHYIYRSESPTEGFQLISTSTQADEGNLDYGNLGMGIDGAFYVSDDGRLYLMHTSTPSGLKINEIKDVNDINPYTIGATEDLWDANLHHWIEGPGIFRRGNFSYLTYTGNHVWSKGYRVGYSYAENLSDFTSFIQPVDNITLMDTDDEHFGLGHSSNTNGPDLDSIYTAYHSSLGAPQRRYNVDRYFASGGLLTANGATHRPVFVPLRPTAEARSINGLTACNYGYSLGTHGDYFTAEYNVVYDGDQTLYFGKTANDGYEIALKDGTISLTKNGAKLGEGRFTSPVGRIVTVRVENGDGVGYVYLNGMRLISYEATAASGELGYSQAEGIEYTAFTNDVFGTSDFEAVKNFPTKFPATSYLKGEMRGFSIRDAKVEKGGVRVGEKQSIVRIGDEYAVKLNKNDWVKYGVDIPEDGMYSLAVTVGKASAGAKLRITVGESVLECEIPETLTETTEKVTLGRMQLKQEVTAMKVEIVEGKAELICFETHDNAEDVESVSVADFRKLNGTFEQEGETLTLTGSGGKTESVAIWGNSGVADFEAEIAFHVQLGNSSNLGFMIRAEHYSYFSAQAKESWRGYYLSLGAQTIFLSRYDYGEEVLVAERISLEENKSYTVKITAQGNVLTVYLDGAFVFSVSDPYAFVSGYLGAYVSTGTMTIENIKYQSLYKDGTQS